MQVKTDNVQKKSKYLLYSTDDQMNFGTNPSYKILVHANRNKYTIFTTGTATIWVVDETGKTRESRSLKVISNAHCVLDGVKTFTIAIA
jgi:hypothetical protein